MDPEERRADHRRGLPAALAAGAAVVVLGVGGLVVATTTGGDEAAEDVPAPSSEPSAPTGGPSGDGAGPTAPGDPVVLAPPDRSAGRCMVPTPETLARVDLAVDATVARADGERVLLEVRRWYAGDGRAPQVALEDPAALARLLAGVTSFEVGQRYLVSAVDGRVTVCGFSARWDRETAALYEQAFGS